MLRVLLVASMLFVTGVSSDVLRFGYDIGQFTRYNKKDMKLAISIWLDEIASETIYDIDPIAYDDPMEMARDLEDDKLDFVTTSSLNFVKFFDKDTLADGFSGGDSDSSTHRLLLVTQADPLIRSWEGLSSAKVFRLDGSDVSELYLKTSLIKHQLPDQVEWITINNYQQGLLKLFFDKGDAAIVTKKALILAAEMNPQISERLKVFDTSTLTDMTPSYFRKKVDIKMQKAITASALKITSNMRGRQVLDVFRTDSIIKVPVSSLIPVEKAYREYLLIKDKER